MKVNYDLHIHSCLSPCSDDSMTPNNILNMAKLNNIDIIAITDHNSCKNCRAAMEIGKKLGICVVPGMELCTREEIHCVCLFRNIESAEKFDEFIYEKMPYIKNDPLIFGNQYVMDKHDNILKTEEKLLTVGADVSINEIHDIVLNLGGACFLAHVNRDSYSVISVLGDIPADLNIKAVELTKNADEEFYLRYPKISDMLILKNSDSHTLESLAYPCSNIELPRISVDICRFVNDVLQN